MAMRRTTATGVRDWTLDKWSEQFWKLYGNHDKKRSVILMWLSVAEYASKIAEDLRRDAFTDFLDHLTHAFAWIVSFVAKCNEDSDISPLFRFTDTPADVVAFKYPGICGLCANARCACGLVAEVIENVSNKKAKYSHLYGERKKFLTDNSGYKAKKVDDWARMFEKIYGGTVKGLPIEHIAFHFMEEVGEVASAVRRIYEEKAKFPPDADQIDSIDKAVKCYENPSAPKEMRRAADLKLTLAVEIADCFS